MCDIPVLSLPKAKAQVFQLPVLFSVSLHFLKEHFVCEILLVGAGAKQIKLENRRVEEWEHDGTPTLKITPLFQTKSLKFLKYGLRPYEHAHFLTRDMSELVGCSHHVEVSVRWSQVCWGRVVVHLCGCQCRLHPYFPFHWGILPDEKSCWLWAKVLSYLSFTVSSWNPKAMNACARSGCVNCQH